MRRASPTPSARAACAYARQSSSPGVAPGRRPGPWRCPLSSQVGGRGRRPPGGEARAKRAVNRWGRRGSAGGAGSAGRSAGARHPVTVAPGGAGRAAVRTRLALDPRAAAGAQVRSVGRAFAGAPGISRSLGWRAPRTGGLEAARRPRPLQRPRNRPGRGRSARAPRFSGARALVPRARPAYPPRTLGPRDCRALSRLLPAPLRGAGGARRQRARSRAPRGRLDGAGQRVATLPDLSRIPRRASAWHRAPQRWRGGDRHRRTLGGGPRLVGAAPNRSPRRLPVPLQRHRGHRSPLRRLCLRPAPRLRTGRGANPLSPGALVVAAFGAGRS